MNCKNKLYRFLSLESLLDILLNNELTLMRPSLWDDPFEQKVFNDFIDRKIQLKIAEVGIDIDLYDQFKDLIHQKSISENVYAQCWTNVSESDAFWRIYSHNNRAIRISTDFSNISKYQDLHVQPIDYADYIVGENLLEIYVNNEDIDILDLISLKRAAFEHEHEIRLIYIDESSVVKNSFAEFLRIYRSDFIDKRNGYLTDEDERELFRLIHYGDKHDTVDDFIIRLHDKKDIIKYSIEYSDFIKDVLVSPFAPNWYVSVIEKLCANYGISFLGKSELYGSSA